MNSGLMFSKASDEWSTPQAFFDVLNAEFAFDVDAAATRENTKCEEFHSRQTDALLWPWTFGTYWLNPPYSRCSAFIAKAAKEARTNGCTVVCLVPSRTDTRWWHEHVWDREKHQPRPGVEVRFIKGRLKFGDGKNSAPFPSVVVVFRPVS
jgi:phage N-6-adenine-methyltransferase